VAALARLNLHVIFEDDTTLTLEAAMSACPDFFSLTVGVP